jgi:thiamine biosynthesis lipoprotein
MPEEGLAPGRKLAAIVALTNAAMATSGNYRNVYRVEGERVVHTMDPRTGRPATSDVASVSVIGPDCRSADGWATAVMVLGTERGLALLEERPELEGLVLQVEGDGFLQHATTGMSRFLAGP